MDDEVFDATGDLLEAVCRTRPWDVARILCHDGDRWWLLNISGPTDAPVVLHGDMFTSLEQLADVVIPGGAAGWLRRIAADAYTAERALRFQRNRTVAAVTARSVPLPPERRPEPLLLPDVVTAGRVTLLSPDGVWPVDLRLSTMPDVTVETSTRWDVDPVGDRTWARTEVTLRLDRLVDATVGPGRWLAVTGQGQTMSTRRLFAPVTVATAVTGGGSGIDQPLPDPHELAMTVRQRLVELFRFTQGTVACHRAPDLDDAVADLAVDVAGRGFHLGVALEPGPHPAAVNRTVFAVSGQSLPLLRLGRAGTWDEAFALARAELRSGTRRTAA